MEHHWMMGRQQHNGIDVMMNYSKLQIEQLKAVFLYQTDSIFYF